MKTNAWLVRPMVLAVGSCFGMSAHANPLGPQVMQGTATFQGLGTRSLEVRNAPGTVINWQGFSIRSGQVTNFIQESAASAVLNRVVGADISRINGSLLSNGRVFLINPAGIVVGASGVIDTAGFVGSTLNMLDSDFLAGKLRFQGDAAAGAITNRGTIRTGFGGSVVLIAPHIKNDKNALIQTPGGELILAAGQSVTVGTLDENGVQFHVQAPSDSVLNLGKLIAQGGAVGVFAGSLKHSGDIRADALVRDEAGRIVLKAQSDANVAGRTSATGVKGGDITVLGDRITVAEGGVIDASGTSGGGRVRVGGDYQGANGALQNATATTVEAGATLRANAVEKGDGGRIIAWSDQSTRFEGTIEARGGAQSGRGGFAEVSGKENLFFNGSVDLTASHGALGTLLLDPLDLYVRGAGGLLSFKDQNNAASSFNPLDPAAVTGNAVTVAPAALDGLKANVSLYAGRYMLIDGAINLTTPGASLSAEVATYTPGVIPGTPTNQLDVAQNITTNGGGVSLKSPFLQAVRSSTITTNGGAVVLESTGSRALQGSSLNVSAGAGAITATSQAGVQLGSVAGSSFNVNPAGFISTGAITTTTPLALSGTSISTGLITSNGNDVALTATTSFLNGSGVSAGTGNVTLTGVSGVFAGTVDTTGAVKLSASSGTVSARVNNAASIDAVSTTSSGFSSAAVSISSDTAVNATNLNATATGCSSSFSCSGASVFVNAIGNINVGSVIASAATSTTNNKSASVNLSSTQGSILATSAASQVRATDVFLGTGQNTGGGVGTAALALNTDVERAFTLRPNGNFNVVLTGSGPNQLNLQPGVAATGQTYSGTLTRSGGGVDFSVTATDTTVTVPTLTLSGFDRAVFNSAPSISLSTPNGALVVNNMVVPEGDTTVPVPPAAGPATQALPVAVSASGNLTVNSYTRQSTAASLPKSTSFSSTSGNVTLGTIAASKDPVTVGAGGNISIGTLTTAGEVSASTFSGNIAVGQIDTTSGSGGVTLSGAKVGALNDTVALEVLSAAPVSITATTIGESTFTSPLDVAAPSVTFNSQNFGGQIGFAGKPVIANTPDLTVNAVNPFSTSSGARFNVSTGSTALTNLTVNASPGAVGSGGVAQVRTEAGQPNDRTYTFSSDGSNFSFAAGNVPATQFVNGTLTFQAAEGNVALGDSNMGPTGGLNITAARGSITGNAALDGGSIILAAGTGSAGSAVTLTTGNIGSSNTSAIALTAGVSGTTSGQRVGSIQTGTLNSAADGAIDLTSIGGNIDVGSAGAGVIGSAAARAGTVTINSRNASGTSAIVSGTVRSGNIFAKSVSLQTLENDITSGNVDATGDVTMLSHRNVTAGTLDASSITISNEFFVNKFPTITVGPIGGARAPSQIALVGEAAVAGGNAVTTLGAVTAAAGASVFIGAGRPGGGGAVVLGGPVTAAPGGAATISIGHQGSSAFQFTRLDAAAGGSVNITSDAGIQQTNDAAGSGITADTVALWAKNGSISNSADPAGRLDLNSVKSLNVTTTGSAAFDGHGNTLTALTLTRERTIAAAPFELANLGGGQVVTLASAPSDLTLVARSPTSPLDVSVTNNAGGIALGADIVTSGGSVALTARGPIDATSGIVTGGASGGGAVTLSTSPDRFGSGDIRTGLINTSPAGAGSGGAITLTAGGAAPGNIIIGGDLRTGPGGGPIAVSTNNVGDIIRSGAAAIVSESFVNATAVNGNVGASGTPLLITSPLVRLSAGDGATATRGFTFASLSGTTDLTAVADNGFNLSSDSAFTTLSINTRGTGTGTPGTATLNLAAPGQLYEFGRPTSDAFGAPITAFQVITAAGATPPSTSTFNARSGDLIIMGSANLTSPTLNLGTLGGNGNVILQGTSATPLTLSNATQNFGAPQDLLITGRVSLTATDQNLSPSRNLTAQARDGSISISGVYQSISSFNGTMQFQGGAGADESVTVTASGAQRISTPDAFGGDAIFRGGTGDRSNVTVVYTGPNVANALQSEEQRIEVHGNILIEGGAGANSDALVTTATADQLIRAGSRTDSSNPAIGMITVRGGGGAGSDARITNTGPGYQQVGESRQSSCSPTCFDFNYQSRDILVKGGVGAGSLAEITAAGAQQIYSKGGTISVIGGDGAASNAKIESTSTIEQRIGQPRYLFDEIGNAAGAITIQGGSVGASTASITTPNAQRLTANNALTVAGMATGSSALASGATQQIRTGGVTVSGGSGDNAPALLQSAGSQTLQALSFSNPIVVAGGAGAGSSARITSADTQSLFFSSLTLTGGTGQGASSRVDTPLAQTLSGSAITLQVQGTSAAPTINAGALIEGQSQSITGSPSITLTGGVGTAGASSDAIIRNVGGSQSVNASVITMTSGTRESTTAIINAGTGSQSISAFSGITLSGSAGADTSAPVAIVNAPATQQGICSFFSATCLSATGPLTLANSGAGAVAIVSGGNQVFNVRSVDVSTSAGSSGTSTLTSASTQWIHTSNLSTRTPAMRVAALGTGKASVESGSTQLLEVDYPDVMAPGITGPADLVIGDTTAAGTSLVKAVDQAVFAGSITVQSGSGGGSSSKLAASGVQTLSTVTGGLTIASGSGTGATASVDPTAQSIVSAAAGSMTGNGGPVSLVSSGPQLLLVMNGPFSLSGLTPAAQATILTSAPGSQQTLLAQGGIAVGTNASIGAGPEVAVAAGGTLPGALSANQLSRTQDELDSALLRASSEADEETRTRRGAQLCR